MDIQENWPTLMSLPTEILHYIFQYLPSNELVRCREVSSLWKQIADSEDIWWELCKREHRDAFEEATLKCPLNLSWRSLFKSLSLWPKLTATKGTWHEFAAHTDIEREIRTVNVRHGVAAVHRANAIEYYDLESFTLIDSFNGDYKKYEENDDVLALMHYLPENGVDRDDCLRIIRKVDDRALFDSVVIIENVINFKIVDKDVYYIRFEDGSDIYVCKQGNGYKSSLIHRIHWDVWGFRNRDNNFEVLTKHFSVYALISSELVHTQYYSMPQITNYLNELVKYNFFDDLNCFRHYLRRCIAKDYDYNPPIDVFASIYNTTTIKAFYGNMLFVGDKFGVLKIYLVNSDGFDPNCPAKEYKINQETSNYLKAITGIEVMEIEEGHMIVISSPQKVITIRLEHD